MVTEDKQKTKKIRVLLVDDQTMIRQGLGYVIQMQPDMEVVGEAADGLEAIAAAYRCRNAPALKRRVKF